MIFILFLFKHKFILIKNIAFAYSRANCLCVKKRATSVASTVKLGVS